MKNDNFKAKKYDIIIDQHVTTSLLINNLDSSNQDNNLVIGLKKNASLNLIEIYGDNHSHPYRTITTDLLEEGATLNQISFIVTSNDNPLILSNSVNHLHPYTTSSVQVKGLLYGNSRLFYDGLIRIEQIAKKSTGSQYIDVLVMNKEAFIKAVPHLEIHNSEVICNHGVSISQINSDHFFYINARGVQKNQAEKILAEGFIQNSIQYITDTSLNHQVRDILGKELYGHYI